MTEQVPPTGPASTAPQEASPIEGGTPATGVAGVDAALADLDRLDDTPLEEHLAAFERAHESLRAALDDAPSVDRPGDPD